MVNSSGSGMAYLSNNREEGKCVFIAYMLNSGKQQMIGMRWSNSSITRQDLQSTCFGLNTTNKINANLK